LVLRHIPSWRLLIHRLLSAIKQSTLLIGKGSSLYRADVVPLHFLRRIAIHNKTSCVKLTPKGVKLTRAKHLIFCSEFGFSFALHPQFPRTSHPKNPLATHPCLNSRSGDLICLPLY
jgi:hypothetical protein